MTAQTDQAARDAIANIVANCSANFDLLRIIGTDDETKFDGMDRSMLIFVKGRLKTPVASLKGDFGIGNMRLLKGLLDFATYKGDGSYFGTVREVKLGAETVTALQFRDALGAGSTFKTVSKSVFPNEITVHKIPWEVVVETTKSKLAEMRGLASLYEPQDPMFSFQVVEGNLVLGFGSKSDSTHSATMVMATDVSGDISKPTSFNISHAMSVIGAAPTPPTIRISSIGLLNISFETDLAVYDFYIRRQE